jgi:hypothetical protein
VIPPMMVPVVQVNVLGAVALSAILVVPSLQIVSIVLTFIAGVGLTVTMMEYGKRFTQAPVVEVGVTRYSTVPAVELLGFSKVWLIVFPDPAVPPTMPPVTVPIVHVKVAGVDEVSVMLGLVLLQMAADPPLVITGTGFTVTVIVYGLLAQLPVVDVGVTIYSTVPGVVLPGLPSTWLIVFPDPGAAPVMPPVIVPIVQLKLLAAVEVSERLVLVPLQIAAVAGLVTAGVGLTVTVIVNGDPAQPPVVETGVTI